MRDINRLTAKKQYIATVDDALIKIREKYPNATKEGAICSYSFYVDNQIVAEMWPHRVKPGWWLRIK